MAVQIPPWLNIDPIEPARIRLQANAHRNAAAASERAAQQQAQELQFRRDNAEAQAAQESEREAAHERAAIRRDEVLKQTHDHELAQAAQQMQLRREIQAEKSAQFQETLRLKQAKAEQEAKSAAKQMQGMQALQKGLQEGQPLQKLIAENAPMLFAGRPDRAVGALQRGSPKAVAPPPDFVARQLKDEQGNPLGINAIPGAHGSIKTLPRTTMSPEGMLRADQLRLGVITKQLEDTDPSSPEFAKLTQARNGIMGRLEQITSGRGVANTPVAGVNPQTSGAAAAPNLDVVRVKSPDGKSGVIPRSQLEEALKGGYEEIEPAQQESDDEEAPAPEDDEEE